MQPKIQVLVGMIASGKSTYARNAAAKGYVIVNDDAIVNAVHAGDYKLYDKKLKPLYKSIENHIVGMAIAMGRNVVVDRGVNVSKAGRVRWTSIAKSLDVPCEAVVFPKYSALEHAERRAKADNRGLPLDEWVKVASSHDARYEHPSVHEGFRFIDMPSFEGIQKGYVAESWREA